MNMFAPEKASCNCWLEEKEWHSFCFERTAETSNKYPTGFCTLQYSELGTALGDRPTLCHSASLPALTKDYKGGKHDFFQRLKNNQSTLHPQPLSYIWIIWGSSLSTHMQFLYFMYTWEENTK